MVRLLLLLHIQTPAYAKSKIVPFYQFVKRKEAKRGRIVAFSFQTVSGGRSVTSLPGLAIII